MYLAVCEGVPEPLSGVIDAPIGRLEGSVLARTVRPDGQRAVTRYRTLGTGHGRALVRLELETGRTHQIRVHMAHIGHPLTGEAHIGHPLTGDFLYGTEAPALIPRPALHAAELVFNHPITGRPMAFTAPLPQDMAALAPEE